MGPHDMINAMFDEHPGCRHFIIAGGERTGDKVAFNVDSTPIDGEYEVVWLTEGGGEEHDKDFLSFLRAYLQVTEETIAMEKENRAKPKEST